MPPHGKLLKLSQPILSLCVHEHVYVIIFYKSKCNELFYHALIEILFKVLTFFFPRCGRQQRELLRRGILEYALQETSETVRSGILFDQTNHD